MCVCAPVIALIMIIMIITITLLFTFFIANVAALQLL